MFSEWSEAKKSAYSAWQIMLDVEDQKLWGYVVKCIKLDQQLWMIEEATWEEMEMAFFEKYSWKGGK